LGMNMNKISSLLLAVAFAGPLLGPHPSAAEGAMAVGSTGNVASAGIAIGNAYNYETRQKAIDEALQKCRDYKPAPKAAAQCQIVGTYARKCYAEALDPKAGTPGAGWAIDEGKEKAASQALANCRATAGVNRRKFCKIVESGCDIHD
jgi:hypothetical protein